MVHGTQPVAIGFTQKLQGIHQSTAMNIKNYSK